MSNEIENISKKLINVQFKGKREREIENVYRHTVKPLENSNGFCILFDGSWEILWKSFITSSQFVHEF